MIYCGTVTFTAQVEADDDIEAKQKIAEMCTNSSTDELSNNTEVIPHYEDD